MQGTGEMVVVWLAGIQLGKATRKRGEKEAKTKGQYVMHTRLSRSLSALSPLLAKAKKKKQKKKRVLCLSRLHSKQRRLRSSLSPNPEESWLPQNPMHQRSPCDSEHGGSMDLYRLLALPP